MCLVRVVTVSVDVEVDVEVDVKAFEPRPGGVQETGGGGSSQVEA